MARTLPVLLLAILGCSASPTPAPPPPLADRVHTATREGTAFLLRNQAKDDFAWRSDVYATFREGTALTPLVIGALQDAGDEMPSSSARRNAARWLAGKARPDGSIDEGPEGFPYPVYTAALTLRLLHHPEFRDDRALTAARSAWRKYLLDRQLTEANGWKPEDKPYGGWGYYPRLPRKPAPGEAVPAQHLLESNLSATVFALEGLRAAGVDDPKILGPARRFVESCQNDDGGFHFIYDDPVRNKAGQSVGPDGRPRFHSYGSTTADGVRALLLCGAKRDDPKVVAAQRWLDKNFTPDRHPGEYIPTHEPNRNAVYFYYAASVAKAFRQLGVTEVRGQPWADPLAEALVAKQQPDGSWANPVELVRENDPVVATAYALTALAECRRASGR